MKQSILFYKHKKTGEKVSVRRISTSSLVLIALADKTETKISRYELSKNYSYLKNESTPKRFDGMAFIISNKRKICE